MDGANKRLAALIASQLPDDMNDALLVLSMARDVVLCLEGGMGRQPADVTRLYAVAQTSPEALRAIATEARPGPPGKSSLG